MSALTKVFLVVLVVLSIILTSATVVFVNRVDNANDTITALKAKNTADEAEISAARSQAESAKADALNARSQMQAQLTQANMAALETQKNLADRDVTVAGLRSQVALQQADMSRLTEGLKASEETKSKLQQIVTDMRQDADKSTAQIAQLNTAVSDLTNKLEVTERERRYFQEQYAEVQSQAGKLTAALKDAGVNVTDAVATAGNKAGAPAINGVIRDIRNIQNIPYATISVGAADSVAKGMEFKIIDRQKGNFLGILTVDTVESNEATGRLRGPHITEIHPGNEVRTQL